MERPGGSPLKKGDWLRTDSANIGENGCREAPVPLFQQAASEDPVMHEQGRIDILLPTYNGERFVERQIESILDQMDARCRMLIRDDASSDETLSLVRRFAVGQPDRVALLEDDGARLGACGNFGRLLEYSDADYVALCDQDDVWLPGHISSLLERIQTVERECGTETPVLAHTDLVVVDENLRTMAPSFWSYSNINPVRGNRLNGLLVQNVVTGCATMVNRALARLACPIPKTAPMHDWWLALVASAFGRIEAVPEKTVLYRQHSSNRLGATCYDWQYVVRRTVDVFCRGAVAKWRCTTQRQAAEFLRRFAMSLNPSQRAAVAAYVELENAGFLDRRLQLLKYGFLKTGPLRNLGWLMMI
jgi:glycosyltransferase involved in cell wall biosynthesis